MAKHVDCPTCGSDVSLPERGDTRPAWCDHCGREIKATDLLGRSRGAVSQDDEDEADSPRRPGLNPVVTVVVVIGGLMLFTCLTIGGVAMLAIAALPAEDEVVENDDAVVVRPPVVNPPVFNPPKVNPPPPVVFQPPKPVEFRPVFPKTPTTIASTPTRPPVMTRPTLPPSTPPAPPEPIESNMIGSTLGDEFREAAPGSAILVGFDAAIGSDHFNETVVSLRAIYQEGDQITRGNFHSSDTGWSRIVTVQAKPGYAVGGLEGKRSLGINELSVIFKRIEPDNKLLSSDTYVNHILESPQPGNQKVQISSGDRVPVGIVGRTRNSDNIHKLSIGLLYNRKRGTIPETVPDQPHISAMVGSPQAKDIIRDYLPKGAMLTGFEIGLGKFINKSVVRMIQPIFTVNAQTISGDRIGNMTQTTVRLTSKPGYAVGGMKVQRGFFADSVAVIFLRVRADGTLDPTDSYLSDWVGTSISSNTKQFTLGGDGRPIYGVRGGRINEELASIGFLFGTQTDPAVKK